MISLQCPFCRGRGWVWIGVAHNAERITCEECQGKGKGPVDKGPLIGLAFCVVSAVLVLGLVWMWVWA